MVQFGGGARGSGSFSQLLKALINPSKYSNTAATNADAANQEGSITSSFLFPGRVPFAVYVEYAGEDTSRGRNYLLGNTALSWGIQFPAPVQALRLHPGTHRVAKRVVRQQHL